MRRILKDDYPKLCLFFEENNIPNIIKNFNAFPLNSESAYNIIFKTVKDRYFISLIEGGIIGLTMLRGWDEGYEIPSFGILIDHRYHSMGLGRKMLEYTLENAKDIGCKKVRLSVFEDNQVAIRLYISFGFLITEENLIQYNKKVRKKFVLIKKINN